MRSTSRPSTRLIAKQRQGGIAALVVTLLLFFAMVLGIGFVNRSLVFEQRASANQYRSTQAFEAAQGGLEWALAQLATDRPVGDDCLPTAEPSGVPFRARYLIRDPATGRDLPMTYALAGVTRPLLPTCVQASGGWNCNCPASAPPMLSAPPQAPAPAFSVTFQDSGRPGLIRVVATGCSALGGACFPAVAEVDATSRIQALLGWLPALRTAPAAALTVRGSIDANEAPFGAHNRDAASSGLALHAGGSVAASRARLDVPAGGSSAGAIAALDSALASLNEPSFFARYFGLDHERWSRQPSVQRLVCSEDCGGALQAAADATRGPTLIHVDGDLLLGGPRTLGSLQRPVLVVATGNVRLAGAVALTGVIYGSEAIVWSGPGLGARIQGALIGAGGYSGDGTPELVYDTDVLARLKREAGTFVRVNGSWRDF